MTGIIETSFRMNKTYSTKKLIQIINHLQARDPSGNTSSGVKNTDSHKNFHAFICYKNSHITLDPVHSRTDLPDDYMNNEFNPVTYSTHYRIKVISRSGRCLLFFDRKNEALKHVINL